MSPEDATKRPLWARALCTALVGEVCQENLVNRYAPLLCAEVYGAHDKDKDGVIAACAFFSCVWRPSGIPSDRDRHGRCDLQKQAQLDAGKPAT